MDAVVQDKPPTDGGDEEKNVHKSGVDKDYMDKLIDSFGGQETFLMKKRLRDRLLLAGGFYDGNPSSVGLPLMSMGDVIEKGNHYKCLAGAVHTPGYFYLNPLASWNLLEKMMADIQRDYNRLENNDIATNSWSTWNGHLAPGFLVMAKCRPEKEYHRAKIIGLREGDNDYYLVELLDYGDHEWVHESKIRYMRRKYLNTLHFQAIQCHVMMDKNKTKDKWGAADGDTLRNLVFNETLVVKFIQRKKVKEGEGSSWAVFLHIQQEKNITRFHVERQLLPDQEQDMDMDPEEELITETENTIALIKFPLYKIGNMYAK